MKYKTTLAILALLVAVGCSKKAEVQKPVEEKVVVQEQVQEEVKEEEVVTEEVKEVKEETAVDILMGLDVAMKYPTEFNKLKNDLMVGASINKVNGRTVVTDANGTVRVIKSDIGNAVYFLGDTDAGKTPVKTVISKNGQLTEYNYMIQKSRSGNTVYHETIGDVVINYKGDVKTKKIATKQVTTGDKKIVKKDYDYVRSITKEDEAHKLFLMKYPVLQRKVVQELDENGKKVKETVIFTNHEKRGLKKGEKFETEFSQLIFSPSELNEKNIYRTEGTSVIKYDANGEIVE